MMKKVLLLLVSVMIFILSGTGEIKDINEKLQKEDMHRQHIGTHKNT